MLALVPDEWLEDGDAGLTAADVGLGYRRYLLERLEGRAGSWRRRRVPADYTYDYAIIRVVPRVDRGEQINVGVILSCADTDFLDARIEVDEALVRAVDAAVDMDAVLRKPGRHPGDLQGRGRGRSDRLAPRSRPLPLAGRAAQHHHPAVRSAHRPDDATRQRASST